jgi:hypothetical protein
MAGGAARRPPRRPIELVGGFETTYLPAHDRDVAETTEHDRRWREDLALLQELGISQLRYPVRWHRVERTPGRFDWNETDRVFEHMRAAGLRPIVDLVHHTSYPPWLERGFADPRFRGAYLRYAEGLARRYPWIEAYTLFNEPFSTLFLAGHEGIWPPYVRGVRGFVRLMRNVLPAVSEAMSLYRALLPGARHVFIDTCERHCAGVPEAEAYTTMANDRRFIVLDLLTGHDLAPERPFVAELLRAGGASLLDLPPGEIDVLGLDFYAHCQWDFAGPRGGGTVPSKTPGTLASRITEYWERYRRPCMLTETNIRGYASDRASWLKYTLEQCEQARDAGVPLEGYCWFPLVDSCDWASLLYRCEGCIDPVGVFWLDDARDRRRSTMSDAFALAASGAPASALPAYEFRRPVVDWLQGFLPQMAHWDWRPAPTGEPCSNRTPEESRIELKICDVA